MTFDQLKTHLQHFLQSVDQSLHERFHEFVAFAESEEQRLADAAADLRAHGYTVIGPGEQPPAAVPTQQ